MSFRDYSLTPGSNTTIAGINIAEDCSPSGLNNALRQFAADGRELADDVDAIDISGKANIASPAFTGQPTVATRGAVAHHANPANTSNREFVQATGAATPSMSNGYKLFLY